MHVRNSCTMTVKKPSALNHKFSFSFRVQVTIAHRCPYIAMLLFVHQPLRMST